MKREHLPYFVSSLIEWRPVRWATSDALSGDYDGRERTLEIFNADASDQRRLRETLEPHRRELQASAGGPLILIFLTRRQSEARYADFVRSFPKPVDASPDVAPPPERCVEASEPNGPHRELAA